MEIIIVSNYYYPETGAAANRIQNMVIGLSDVHNHVNVICPLPNYPHGKVFDNFKGKIKHKEIHENFSIYRFWIFPSISKHFVARIFSMLSFALSLWMFSFNFKKIKKTEWVIIQNSPLLVSFSSIILFKYLFNRKIALNVSDLWPLSALELGFINKGKFYSFLEWIEKFNYRNADYILGQSNEILEHINQIVKKPQFLYRNIQLSKYKSIHSSNRGTDFKIVYAGLLGVAQGILNIVKNIDFKKLGVQFHIYGSGNELDELLQYIKDKPGTNVVYKGSLSKQELNQVIGKYHTSIVPLRRNIKGAVPSKIFELINYQIPIIYVGGGEAAGLIEKWKIGYTSCPSDFIALEKNIDRLKNLSKSDYNLILDNCKVISNEELDFKKQIMELKNILI